MEAIDQAVAKLPPRELAEFAAWLEVYEAQRFDAAIERDALEGGLDGLAHQALRAMREGKARDL